MSEPISFHLIDAHGESHEYTCTPHKASDGFELSVRLMGAAGEPLGRLIGGNLKALGQLMPTLIAAATKASKDDVDDQELFMSVLSDKVQEIEDLDLDFGQVVKDLKDAILSAGAAKFARDILSHTYRDGKLLGSRQRDSVAFDTAYQANYLELLQALWEVIQINGFLGYVGS